MKEVIASSIFVLPTADALPCICFSKNKQCDCINSFDQDMVLMVSTLWENKRNKSRKSFHGSRRGLGFHLELNFQCNQMATTINMMFFHFTCLLIIQFFPIEQESNILPEQVHVHTIWHTSSPPQKKTISLHYFCTIQNNSMETQVYFDSINLDIAQWLGVISSCNLGLDIPEVGY